MWVKIDLSHPTRPTRPTRAWAKTRTWAKASSRSSNRMWVAHSLPAHKTSLAKSFCEINFSKRDLTSRRPRLDCQILRKLSWIHPRVSKAHLNLQKHWQLQHPSHQRRSGYRATKPRVTIQKCHLWKILARARLQMSTISRHCQLHHTHLPLINARSPIFWHRPGRRHWALAGANALSKVANSRPRVCRAPYKQMRRQNRHHSLESSLHHQSSLKLRQAQQMKSKDHKELRLVNARISKCRSKRLNSAPRQIIICRLSPSTCNHNSNRRVEPTCEMSCYVEGVHD